VEAPGPGWTYHSSVGDVLSKDYSLGLDDEEIDELLNIVKSGFEGLLGNLVVSFGADLTSDA